MGKSQTTSPTPRTGGLEVGGRECEERQKGTGGSHRTKAGEIGGRSREKGRGQDEAKKKGGGLLHRIKMRRRERRTEYLIYISIPPTKSTIFTRVINLIKLINYTVNTSKMERKRKIK